MTRSLTNHLAALMIAALVLISLPSCGGNAPADPIDATPSGVRQVTVMNLNEMAAANGPAEIAGKDGLTPTAEEAIGMFIPADMLRPLAAVLSVGSDFVDTSNTVIFTAANGYTGIILKVTDHEQLTEALNPYRDEASDFGDYLAYTTGRRIIAISDGLCVIAPDADTVKAVGQKNGNSHISGMTGVKDFLASENTIRSARPASEIFGKKMEGLWLCTSLRLTDNSAVADLSAMRPDGQPDSIGARIAGEIDPGVLGFVPGGSSVVIASGLQGDDAKLFGIEEIVKNYFPGDIVMSKSGTTLWYARPAGTVTSDNLLSPQVWNFAGIIQMPQADGEKAIINMQNMTRGMARLDSSIGCYTLTSGDESITYGYINGCFAQSANGPVNYGNSNPFTDDFHGARVAALIDIPRESSLRSAVGLPCGASLSVKVTTEKIRAKLAFYGNNHPLLSTVGSVPTLRNLLPLIIGTK